jgi:phage FluMu protein Com
MPRKPRICLKCNKTFSSRGPGNRICPRCREVNSKLSYLSERMVALQRGEKRHNGEVMIPPDRLDLEFLYTEYHAAPPLPKRLRRRGLRSSA